MNSRTLIFAICALTLTAAERFTLAEEASVKIESSADKKEPLPLSAEQSRTLEDAVKKLSSDDFESREEATAVLMKMPKSAFEPLTNHLNHSPDAEVRTRLKKVLAKLQWDKAVVVVDTSMGAMEIELYYDKAPNTVKNFLSYVNDKFYEGVIFHRVIANFMIQGGGFTTELKEKKSRDPIENESDNGLSNDVGTISMARTSDPNSATSQFFINVVDNRMGLDRANCPDGVGYCVFGKVISGMDVVNKIKAVATGKAVASVAGGIQMPMRDVPIEAVVIKSVTIKK